MTAVFPVAHAATAVQTQSSGVGSAGAPGRDGFAAMIEAMRGRRRRDRASVGVVEGGAILRYQPRPSLWPAPQSGAGAMPLKPAAAPATPPVPRYVLLVPDVSGGQAWRVQRFDPDGFSGHEVYASQEAAIEAAIGEGFTLRDDTALDQLQRTPRWDRGCFVVDLVRQINSRQITRAEGDRLLEEYDARHAQQVWSEAHAGDEQQPDGPAHFERSGLSCQRGA